MSNLFLTFELHGPFLQILNDFFDCQMNSSSEIHGIKSSCDRFKTFFEKSSGQNSGCGCSVSGHIVSFVCNLQFSEITCLISKARIFINLSLNSIDLATVTPSLVILGPPKDESKTTFLSLGPRVTCTASANLLQPSKIFSLHSLPNFISLPAK